MVLWDWTQLFILVVALVALVTMAGALRKECPQQIYVIWYITSFFFLLFLGLEITAEKHQMHLVQVCGSYEETCKFLYGYLTNLDDELTVLGIVTALAIGPQLMTYVLSGISGAANAPKFVWQIEQAVVWSFIKFAAGLGGIRMASPFAKLAMSNTVELPEFSKASTFIIMAFSYATAQHVVHLLWQMFSRQIEGTEKANWLTRQLLRLHKFATRNVREE